MSMTIFAFFAPGLAGVASSALLPNELRKRITRVLSRRHV